MSCIYKPHSPETDGPAQLYHRMNQMDCAMKKVGGSRKARSKSRSKSKKRKPRTKTLSWHKYFKR